MHGMIHKLRSLLPLKQMALKIQEPMSLMIKLVELKKLLLLLLLAAVKMAAMKVKVKVAQLANKITF